MNSMNEVKESHKQEANKTQNRAKKSGTIVLKINSNVITIIVLLVFVFISVVQAFELGNIKEKISAGEINAATTGASSSASDSSTPANLKDLPSMVGGC